MPPSPPWSAGCAKVARSLAIGGQHTASVQLDHAGQLAVLVGGPADGVGGGVIDNEQRADVRRRTAATKRSRYVGTPPPPASGDQMTGEVNRAGRMRRRRCRLRMHTPDGVGLLAVWPGLPLVEGVGGHSGPLDPEPGRDAGSATPTTAP